MRSNSWPWLTVNLPITLQSKLNNSDDRSGSFYLASLFWVSYFDDQSIWERYWEASRVIMSNDAQINFDNNWKIFWVSLTYNKSLWQPYKAYIRRYGRSKVRSRSHRPHSPRPSSQSSHRCELGAEHRGWPRWRWNYFWALFLKIDLHSTSRW